MISWIGRTLSKVEIQRLLGRGGMAEVYLGRHITLNRTVAVKILHGHLSEDATVLVRFRSEAQAVAALRHPNIVQVYDFDVADDQPYIVMEYIEGPTLADYLRAQHRAGRRLPPEIVARLLTYIAAALDYAHAHNIVHRDVKPSNVLLRREAAGHFDLSGPLPDDVQPVLTDFGVARLANATIRTASGVIVGTPAYMSPEQIGGEQVDSRSDIYSLGIMLYEMLSARLPFESDSETVAATLVKHITEPPPPLPEVPPAVEAVVMRALAKNRNARYQRAGDLARDLRSAFGLPTTPSELAFVTPSAAPQPGVTPVFEPRPKLQPRRSRLVWMAAVLVMLVVVAALALIFGSDLLQDDSVPSSALTGDGQTFGALRFDDGDAELDRAVLRVEGITPPADGKQYEVWLLGGETRRSLGILDVDERGNGMLQYTDAEGENLLQTFSAFEITVEPEPDPSPLPTSEVIYSGGLPPGPLTHIRHVLVRFGSTPGEIGLTIGVMRDTRLIEATAEELAETGDDLDAMKRHAEALVNIIEGENGEHFGDLDGDGTIINPGDGYGLLISGSSAGYIQTSIEHARYAVGSQGATAWMAENVALFEVAAQNLGGWTVQLRDESLAILGSKNVDEAAAHIERAVELADLLLNGQDVNGNGQVEPLPEEGGAQTMYEYARRLADIPVMSGPNRMPAPLSADALPQEE